MAVYIVVGLVVLAGLIMAYRTLGRGAAATVDPVALMRTVLTAAGADVAALDELATAMPLLPTPPSAIATARTLRRRFLALAQQLEGVDVAALDDAHAGTHALLAAALDELVWAASLCADENYGTGEGMRTAVSALRTHAGRCLQDAAPLLSTSAVAEEVERAP